MYVTQPFNELSGLALVASDAAYFTATLSAPQILAPLQDTPTYNILPAHTITGFADIQLIDQVYAAELNDPRLSSSSRAAIEQAREMVQRAGLAVAKI